MKICSDKHLNVTFGDFWAVLFKKKFIHAQYFCNIEVWYFQLQKYK